MRLLRESVVVGGVALLMMGYASSQWFALTGRASEWARLIDVPAVRGVAALLLGAAIVAGAWPIREEGPPTP